MDHTALDSVFDQVGYCGIWCGSCAVGTSALMEVARRYRALCESLGLGHWGAEGFDYEAFLKGLDSISELEGCRGCRKGGGRSGCEIRSCANGRGLSACSSCADTKDCEHAEILEHMRSGASEAGLIVLRSPEEGCLSVERRRKELASLWWGRALFG
jgi:hypothetical protein